MDGRVFYFFICYDAGCCHTDTQNTKVACFLVKASNLLLTQDRLRKKGGREDLPRFDGHGRAENGKWRMESYTRGRTKLRD